MQNDQLVFNGFDCRVPKKIVSFLNKDCYQPAKISGKNALREKRTVTILQDAYDAQKKLVNFLCIVADTCILNSSDRKKNAQKKLVNFLCIGAATCILNPLNRQKRCIW